MKILVVGDQHFRYELPYSAAFPDGRKSEWEEVKKTIVTTASECDAVVLMGDNLNSRHNHSAVIGEFVDFLKAFGSKEVHILSGNHERYGENTALDFLQKLNMPNWRVYTRVTNNIRIGDLEATFIPYTTYNDLGVSNKEEAERVILSKLPKANIAFVHHAISGTKDTEFFNEVVLSQEELEGKFGMTFGGHVHKSQRLSDKVVVTGNIFTQEVGEYVKSVFVWESKLGAVAEVMLPVRGIYKAMIGQQYLDSIPAHSLVKAVVTDPMTSIETLKEELKKFDASIIVEQYPDKRVKTHYESGVLDLSVENMLKVFAEQKKIPINDLMDGYNLIKG